MADEGLRTTGIIRRAACVVVLCAIAAPHCSAASGGERVAVLFSRRGPYRAAAEALATRVRSAGHDCRLIELPKGDQAARQSALDRLAGYAPTVIASGGVTATTQALEATSEVPVVFFLVPNALDAPFVNGHGEVALRVVGVTSDVAPGEQLAWIRKTRPGAQRIAVPCSVRTRRTVDALQQAARGQGLEIIPIDASRDQFPKAIEALGNSRCDGVLMIPDARVYNSANVQRLLLWGIRSKKPVWAFSGNVVKAGAFAGVYCERAVVGAEAARLICEIIDGTVSPSAGLRYPQQLGRAVNVRTAELIGVSLANEVLDSDVVRFGAEK